MSSGRADRGPRLDLPDAPVVVTADGTWTLAAPGEHPEPTPTRLVAAQSYGGSEDPGGAPGPEGLAVVGEAAAVLRALLDADPAERLGRASIEGTVQLVYIDPPYNTGGRFAHYRDGVDHVTWLTAMRAHLALLRRTLAASGSLWLHVDDSEMAYATVVADEVFGRGNRVATIVVENNPKGRQLDRHFAGSHDYLLVYARDAAELRLEAGTTDTVDPADFPHEDETGPYRLLPLRNTNKRFTPATVPTLHYPLWASAETGQVSVSEGPGLTQVWPVFGDLSPAVWRWSIARAAERGGELRARMVRGSRGPRLDVAQVDRLHPGRTKKLRTLWSAAEVGSSDAAKAELKALFPGRAVFATPKPERLLARVVEAATRPGDLVLDCFAGSGTTAAVAHKAGRAWIAVERAEATAAEFLVPRLRAVAAGADPGGVSGRYGFTGGGAVRLARLSPGC